MDRIVERMRLPFMGDEFRRMALLDRMPEGMGMTMVRGHGLGDLELVKVTPALAEGLGISEGLLVVDIDSGNTLGLRPGDVITSIGGRRATTPGQAMRILSTYETNEAVQFEVMRQRRRQTVNGRVPEVPAVRWRVSPGSWTLPRRQMEELHQLHPRLEELQHQLPRMREHIEDGNRQLGTGNREPATGNRD
jgi:hypothetical protein